MQSLRTCAQRAAVFLAIGSLAAALTGCGGNVLGQGDNPPNNSAPTSSFANKSASGTAALDSGKAGALALTTSGDGRSATGTLTVTAQTLLQSRAVVFPLGPFGFSGSVDPDTGAFTLNGTVTGVGPVAITGTLPTATAAGAFQVRAQGEVFDGTLPVGGNNGGGNNGGGNNGGGSTFSGSLTVGNRVGNPIVAGNSIVPTTPGDVEATLSTNTIGSLTSNVLSTAFNQVLGSGLNIYPTNAVTLTVADFDGAIAAGETYNAITGPDIMNPFVNYSRLSVIVLTGVGAQKAYTSHSGTITVVAISGTSVTLRANNVLLQSLPGDPTAGPGSFTLTGTITMPVVTP